MPRLPPRCAPSCHPYVPQARQAELRLRHERQRAAQQAQALRRQLGDAEHQQGEASAALGLQRIRFEAAQAEQARAEAGSPVSRSLLPAAPCAGGGSPLCWRPQSSPSCNRRRTHASEREFAQNNLLQASGAAAKVLALEGEVRVARLAAQIQSDAKAKELQQARFEITALYPCPPPPAPPFIYP